MEGTDGGTEHLGLLYTDFLKTPVNSLMEGCSLFPCFTLIQSISGGPTLVVQVLLPQRLCVPVVSTVLGASQEPTSECLWETQEVSPLKMNQNVSTSFGSL